MCDNPNASPAISEQTVSIQLNLVGLCRRFEMFDTPLCGMVCEGVFSGASYPIQPFVEGVRTIIDIGANVGAASVYFALNYPDAHVVAFEPSPRSYRLLVRNVHGLPNISTYNFGLAKSNARVPLYQGLDDSVTDSVCISTLNSSNADLVDLRDARSTLDDMGIEGVDILKLDTEGCEVQILAGLVDLLPRVGVLYVEYHDASDRLIIDRLMIPGHVLCRGQIVDQHRGELCYVARNRFPSEALFNRLCIRPF